MRLPCGTTSLVDWASFAEILNNYLTDQLSVAEDRLLGPRFVSDDDLTLSNVVPGKVLIYLWDDLLRHHGRDVIFNAALVKSYGSLSQRVTQKEIVFSDGFLGALDDALQDGGDDA